MTTDPPQVDDFFDALHEFLNLVTDTVVLSEGEIGCSDEPAQEFDLLHSSD